VRTLVGHVSAETAYVQPDYPYSFTLRCERRVWVETKLQRGQRGREHGQRVVTQTRNPKTGRWNAPKAGVYHALAAIALDDDPSSPTHGHVVVAAFSAYRGRAELEAFLAAHGEAVEAQLAAGWRAAYEREAQKILARAKAACAAALATIDAAEIACVITGEDHEDPEDCTTHEHEVVGHSHRPSKP